MPPSPNFGQSAISSSNQVGDMDVLSDTAVPYSPQGMRLLGLNPAPSSATLARWRLRGRFGVRPGTFLRGGRRYVTPAAMSEFFRAVTAAADGIPFASMKSARDKKTAMQQASDELAADGA